MPPDVASASPDSDQDSWLRVNEASELLGVSLSTLRRWADAGKIPIHRTVGGHRRFKRQELRDLVAAQSALPAAPLSTHETSPGDQAEMMQQEWHRKLRARPAAERMRGLGQRLLGLLIQHVHSRAEESRFLVEAGAVGTMYGREASIASISLQETVRAFLFFRRTCSQLTYPAAGMVHPVDVAEAVKLQEQINTFMDAVLLEVLAGYESQRLFQGDASAVVASEDVRP
jgi:excisionase family DNA binding protein